jgi:tetratricopeptide (TPR) repeat protein
LPIHLSVIEAAQDLAKDGKIDEAVSQFKYLLTLDSTLNLDPEKEAKYQAALGLIERSWSLIRDGKVDEARANFEKAQQLDPKAIDARSWNNLCWNGSLNQKAELVQDACEQAVSLAGEDKVAIYRDSRGVNRALLGDLAGAIEDFEAYVAYLAYYKDNPALIEDMAQREGWIEALKAGRNPLDEETLKLLRE